MASPNTVPVTALRGLALPARRTRGGYFESKTLLDLAWGDLLIALLVPQGSRAMRRSVGSGLENLLFSPLDADTNAAAFVVVDAAVRDLPHIRVTDVKVVPNGKVLSISITFGLVTDPGTQEQRTVSVAKNTVGPALEA